MGGKELVNTAPRYLYQKFGDSDGTGSKIFHTLLTQWAVKIQDAETSTAKLNTRSVFYEFMGGKSTADWLALCKNQMDTK